MAEKDDQPRQPAPERHPEPERWRRIDESDHGRSTKRDTPDKQGASDTHETPPPKKQ
jgi:hypothetical protein